MPVHRRTALGIGRTFQNVGLVKNATVRENLVTAQHLQVAYDLRVAEIAHAKKIELEVTPLAA